MHKVHRDNSAPGRVGRGNELRGPQRLSSGSAAGATALRPDNTSVPLSYDSRASPRAISTHRSADSHTAASSRQSPESVSAMRIILASTTIPERLAIERQEAAHPSLTEPKALGAPLSRRSFALGPTSFCGDGFQRLDVQGLVRHHLFESTVLVFQLAELLHVSLTEPGIFRPPLIKVASEMPCFWQSSWTPMPA